MPVFDYGDLRYHEACYKASHNSYERKEMPVTAQLAWNKNDHHEYGCRGLEIDLYQADNGWQWSVSHLPPYSGNVNDQFAAYLQQLGDWSLATKDHDVVTVMMDLKKTRFDDRDFPHFFDAYLQRNFPVDRIYKPVDLMGGHADLVKAVMADGWPKLNDLRERFIFCFSGNEKRKRMYANRRPKERLCFSDQKLGPNDAPPSKTAGKRVFFNFHLADEDLFEDAPHEIGGAVKKTKLPKLLKFFRDNRGFMTRGYGLNGRWAFENGRKVGVNNLSTDMVTGSNWAKVGARPFVKAVV